MVRRIQPRPVVKQRILNKRAGAPATPSVAAHAPMEGAFYSPEGETVTDSQLGAVEDTFMGRTRTQSVPIENMGSADREVVETAVDSDREPNETLEEAIARIKKIRKPLGAFSQKLALPERRGYHRHWFNDVAGRIEEANANGWAHVKDKDGRNISRCVGSGRDKAAMYAYAMEIPEVFWLEDLAARNRAASEKMDALRAAPFRAAPGTAKASDKGKFYDPSEESGAGPLQIVKG